MDIFDQVAERRIAEAMARGEFDALPGAGRPIDLEDDSLVAPELRVGYRILKNAGFVPEEVRWRAELRGVEQLLAQSLDREERAAASARLRILLTRLDCGRGAALQAHYFGQLVERLSQREAAGSPPKSG